MYFYSIFCIIVSSQSSNSCPIGTILAYTGRMDQIPRGWYLCDGSNGTPDLRDRFLEGAGSYTIGTYVKAGLPNITGSIDVTRDDENFSDSDTWNTYGALYSLGNSQRYGADPKLTIVNSGTLGLGFDASHSNAIYGSSEVVQPAAYAVYYIIRLK